MLGENNQQFSQINTTSLGNILFSKGSPLKANKYYRPALTPEEFLQNLKPMKDVNTSLDQEIDDEEACHECEECHAFH